MYSLRSRHGAEMTYSGLVVHPRTPERPLEDVIPGFGHGRQHAPVADFRA